MSSELNLTKIPKHVAIIMDGNRRWAKKKGLSAIAGHDFVAEKVIETIVDEGIELGISYLTFWAFSTENWKRNKREVKGMMMIFRKGLARSAKRLFEKGVQLRIIGDMKKFPDDIQEQAKRWVELSRENKKMVVNFAMNYGGRDEIVRAISKMDIKTSTDESERSKVTEDLFSKYLDTAETPDPDLIIRTGGEQRLSGFMSWQSAYSELYFTKTLMPDFGADSFEAAILEYQRRRRRFGG